MTEGVRASLGRAICRQYQTDRGELPTIAFSPALEERLLGVDRADRSGRGARARPADAQGLAARIARALETRRGTARAFVLASAPAAPLATVRASAAAHRRALAQRSARARPGGARRRCWSDMHLKRFRGETVRDALAPVREELGPDALVLSTQLVPGARLARARRRREVEVDRRRRARRCRRSGRRGRQSRQPLPERAGDAQRPGRPRSRPPGSPPSRAAASSRPRR